MEVIAKLKQRYHFLDHCMRFRLTQRSMILDDHEVPILLEFHGISYIWVPATATRNPCSRLAVVGACSPTNLCSPKLRFCSPTREIVQLCSQKIYVMAADKQRRHTG